MGKPVLCKDCLHFRPVPEMHYIASHKCGALRHNAYIELVTGTTEPARYRHCWQARLPKGRCGPDGKLFKPSYAAQGIEARSGETGTGSTVGESPVLQDAPDA